MGESTEERGQEDAGCVKQMPSDVSRLSAAAARHEISVGEEMPADMLERAVSEIRTCLSPQQTLQFTVAQENDCSEPVSSSSPAESAGKCAATPKSPGDGSRPLVSLRRSSRAVKVKQFDDAAVTSPKRAATACISPTTLQSPKPKRCRSVPARGASKSPPVQDSQSLHSSRQETVPSSKDVVAVDLLGCGRDLQSVDDQKLYTSEDIDMRTPEQVTSIGNEQSGHLFSESGYTFGECYTAGIDQNFPLVSDVADDADVIPDKMPERRRSSPRKVVRGRREVNSAGGESDLRQGTNVDSQQPSSVSKHQSTPAVTEKTSHTRRSSPRKVDFVGQDQKSVDTTDSGQQGINADVYVENELSHGSLAQSEHARTLSVAADSDSTKILDARRSSPGKIDSSGQVTNSASVDDDQMHVSNDGNIAHKTLNISFPQPEHVFSANAAYAASATKIPRRRHSRPRKEDSDVALDPVGIRRRSRKSVGSEKEPLHVTDNDENKPLSTICKEDLMNMDCSGLDVNAVAESDQQCIGDDVNIDSKQLSSPFKQLEDTSTPDAGDSAHSDSSRKILRTRRSSPRKMNSNAQDVKSVIVDGEMCADAVNIDNKPLGNSSNQSDDIPSPSALGIAVSDSSEKKLHTRRSSRPSTVASDPLGIGRRSRKSVSLEREPLRVTDENKPLSTLSKEHWQTDGSGLDVSFVDDKNVQLGVSDDVNVDNKSSSSSFEECGRMCIPPAVADSEPSSKIRRARRSSCRKMNVSEQDAKSVKVDDDQMICISDDSDDKPLNSFCNQSDRTPSLSNSDSTKKTVHARRSSWKTDIAAASDSVVMGRSKKSVDAETEPLHVTDNVDNKPLSTLSSEQWEVDGSVLDKKPAGADCDGVNVDSEQLSHEHVSSPPAEVTADSNSSTRMLRTRRPSPREMDIGGQDVDSVKVGDGQLCVSDDVIVDDKQFSLQSSSLTQPGQMSAPSAAVVSSGKKLCMRHPRKSDVEVASDQVGIRRSGRKSVGAEREPVHGDDYGNDDDNKPLSTLSKELQNIPGAVTLPLDGAAKPVKKRTGVQNRRKSSYSGKPQEKRPRGHAKSLEPGLSEKSSTAHSFHRRKSVVSGTGAKVESDSARDQPVHEDSGRRVTRPRKCNAQPVPADTEAESAQLEDSPDLLQHDEELESQTEHGDMDGSSTAAASLDDVRVVHLCSSSVCE